METHPLAACCWCTAKLVKVGAHWWCQTKACTTRQRSKAIVRQVPKIVHGQFQGYQTEYWWVPLPKQVTFLEMAGKRKLLGGAAGPGKSDVSRKGAYSLALTVPTADVVPHGTKTEPISVLLLRKTRPELERTHIRAMRREQFDLGFDWMEQAKECRFKNGSVIECGHMEDDAAVQKYLSSEYDLIIPEEAVQYPPDALMELMSRARTSNERVKALGGPWVWLPTNPGGPSHHLLKQLFINKEPDIEQYPAMKKYKPEQWGYLHATLDDNPYIDPDYEDLSLSGLRKARYAQLRHGDWDAAEGTFFDMFSKATHTRTVKTAPGMTWVESLDWGYKSYGAFGAFVHVGDNHWHCAKGIKFKGMEPEEVADLIKRIREELGYVRPNYGVADPSIFGEQRGESIAETFSRFGVIWRSASNKRASEHGAEKEMGWPRLARAFRFGPDGKTPWLTFDPIEASYLVRSIPALLSDKNNIEDVDTNLDDHGADMCRYFIMSRPPIDKGPQAPKEPDYPVNSWGFWRKWHEKQGQAEGALA